MQGPLAAGALESDRLGFVAWLAHWSYPILSFWGSGRWGRCLIRVVGSGEDVYQAPGTGVNAQ